MDLLIVKITEVCFFFDGLTLNVDLNCFFASFQFIYVEEPIIRRLYTIITVHLNDCQSLNLKKFCVFLADQQ